MVAEAADLRATLDRPQRWTEVSELGEWSLIAREALRTGVRLPLETAPECVCVIPVSDLDDVPNPKSDRVLAPIIPVLRRQLRELDGSVVVLGRYNAHVRGLYSAVRGSLIVQEGVEFDGAYTALAVVDTALGDPRRLAQAAVDLLASTCRGFNAKVQQQLSASLLSDRLDRGKRRQIAPLLDALEPLYATSDFPTWCRAIRQVQRHPPEWLHIDLPASLRLLSQLRPHEAETPREALDAAVRHRRDAGTIPRRCASTIHKAKGLEFDHVIVAHFSASPFPDTHEARRLLYVALSRARRSVTFIVSGRAPSPLLP